MGALVMGDGVPCYGALEIVGLLLLLFLITSPILQKNCVIKTKNLKTFRYHIGFSAKIIGESIYNCRKH